MAFFNTLCLTLYLQGDHSPDNVKFPDNALTGLRHFSAALGMLSLTHIMPALVLLSVVRVEMQQYMIRDHTEHLRQNRLLLNTCMDTNMQFTINSFRQLFPDKMFSLTFP